MALAFGALSFTKLKDNTIEVTAPGKQHLNYEDTQELINWLRNLLWEQHKYPGLARAYQEINNRPEPEWAVQDDVQAQVGQL